MATLTANAAQSNVQARFNNTGLQMVVSVYTGTASLANADVIQMVKVPKGAVVHDVRLYSPGTLWEGTSNAILAVGDGDNDDRFLSSSIASATHIVGMTHRLLGNSGGGLGYEYSAADTIDITIRQVSGTMTAAPILAVSVLYSLDNVDGTHGG